MPQSNKSLLIKTNEENLVEAATSQHRRRRLDELSAKGIQDSPMTNDFIRFYQLMISKVIKFLPNAAFHTKQTTVDLKFQKRRSLDHLLLKWSPMVPSPTAALVQIESWYKEVNSSPGNAARSQIAHHGMLTQGEKMLENGVQWAGEGGVSDINGAIGGSSGRRLMILEVHMHQRPCDLSNGVIMGGGACF